MTQSLRDQLRVVADKIELIATELSDVAETIGSITLMTPSANNVSIADQVGFMVAKNSRARTALEKARQLQYYSPGADGVGMFIDEALSYLGEPQ